VVFPQLEVGRSPAMWAHAGHSTRVGFPGCRATTWSVMNGEDRHPAPQLVNGRERKLKPTEPTYEEEDVLAFEPPKPIGPSERWVEVATSTPQPAATAPS
jgi:hypothetical protein